MHERVNRRVLAVYLPEFLCELARGPRRFVLEEVATKPAPMGVLLAERTADVRPQQRLAAVCARAFCAGVRPGQTSAEAHALLAHLQIEVVEYCKVQEQLLAIAEIVAQYGTTPSWNAVEHVDTVWLDISGVGHLYDGEQNLCEELAEQVRSLGHRVRLAVAGGPHIAQAVARFGHHAVQLVDSSAQAAALALSDLPLSALPLDQARIFWLGRLGIFQVGQLAQLPKAAASSRLGPTALQVLQLVEGVDPEPLVAGQFPRSLQEECSWEEPAKGISPLLFAVHGLVARLSARLKGRGEACFRIECKLIHDPATVRHLQVSSSTLIDFDLAAPLYHAQDLERVIRTRLQACELPAPTIGLHLHVAQLTPQTQHQLGLSGQAESSVQNNGSWTEAFPVLAAELQADIGSEQVGTLEMFASHIPEDCSAFQPLLSPASNSTSRTISQRSAKKRYKSARSSRSSRKHTTTDHKLGLSPESEYLTRLLPYPQKLNVPLRVGETFAVGHELYVIKSLRFVRRVSDVTWWKETNLNRIYHWAWLRSAQGGTEALLFIDQSTGDGFVQAFCD